MTNSYTQPVSELLKLGRPERPWLDYSTLGFTHEDIPELLRLVKDNNLRYLDLPEDFPEDEDLPDWYGQIHAWRALAQLKVEEAIPAVLGILRQIDEDDDDWLTSDARLVFGTLGPVAIEPLKRFLADENNPMYARVEASMSLVEIGNRYPEERVRCIQGITVVLEKYETNDEEFNGFLVSRLIDAKAVEQIELIKGAFEANAVDEFINGDVEDVQIELGLLEKRITPERPLRFGNFPLAADVRVEMASKSRQTEHKQKNKRKQEKKSRKKNRKRR
ncbi:MAG: DUF1186 domain-containing protein [Anaerolineae bacterium]|nr:DUF1186 domain-containing protein [Anaerolineae bacterium]MBL8107618.1 DUF1186 domain-containing protein [Anaerolineales bacterium]MCC7189387.1 DUF1186 domain-containing protein [Anaerolineales bacterium]